MNKSHTNILTLPPHADIYWVSITKVLCFLSPPMMYGGDDAREYRCEEADFINSVNVFHSSTVCNSLKY